jgi:hypothetical protein
MSTQVHHHEGTSAEWFEDAAFLLMLFSAIAIVATIALLIVAF